MHVDLLTFGRRVASICPLMRTICLLLFLFVAIPGRAQIVNGIYAIVNDTVITYQEVEHAIVPVMQVLANRHRGEPQVLEQKIQQLRMEKIEELIERQLILHDFRTGPYQLPDSIIDDVIRQRVKERFGDRATLTKTLQAEGMTFDSYRKQVREDYIVSALKMSKVSPEKIVISPNKIESYYNDHQNDFKVTDQVKIRMIVLNKSTASPEAARKLADEILAKLKEGASFAEMAAVYSDSGKDKGGDRGWIDRTYFKKELSDVAFSLKPGKYSEVLDLPEACYLIQVDDVKTAHIKPLADAREEIEKTLKSAEETRLKSKWIERLKTKSFIRYF